MTSATAVQTTFELAHALIVVLAISNRIDGVRFLSVSGRVSFPHCLLAHHRSQLTVDALQINCSR